MAKKKSSSPRRGNPARQDIVSRAVRHPWVWGGVGILIRGGGRFNTLLGLGSLLYGLYDLQKPIKTEEQKAAETEVMRKQIAAISPGAAVFWSSSS